MQFIFSPHTLFQRFVSTLQFYNVACCILNNKIGRIYIHHKLFFTCCLFVQRSTSMQRSLVLIRTKTRIWCTLHARASMLHCLPTGNHGKFKKVSTFLAYWHIAVHADLCICTDNCQFILMNDVPYSVLYCNF